MANPLSLEILAKLISFDTTSCHSNLELMAYIQGYLNSIGVDSELIHCPLQNKANLYATIGPADRPGVMLSGHTDTVPVTGQQWQHEPFRLSLSQGRLYGRGTADMKGFIAVVLSALPDFVSQPLHTPIHLAFSYDEEVGCVGVRRLIDMLQQHPIKPAICIIGEPTSMEVVTAHKGKVAVRVSVTGKTCHSGMAPYGVNAVNYAARLITWLEQLASEKQQQGPYEAGYDIPYSTVHTGTVIGGNALNIVPDLCQFMFEIRNIAEENPYSLLNQFYHYAGQLKLEMQQIDPACDIQFEITTEYPGLRTTEDSTVVTFVRDLTQSSSTSRINFGTEGGLFSQLLNIPTVVCGPGSMDQGHKADEFIELQQIERCELFMRRLLQALSTPQSKEDATH